MESNEWYERMSKALKRRERAQLYLQKWTDELASAQEDMRQLALEQNNQAVTENSGFTVTWAPTTNQPTAQEA